MEVETLKGLEQMALEVLRSGEDALKWTQLNRILDDDLMVDYPTPMAIAASSSFSLSPRTRFTT